MEDGSTMGKKKLIAVAARGQVVSLLTAGTGIFATLLSQVKPVSMNFPLLLSVFNYILCSTYLLRPKLRELGDVCSLYSAHSTSESDNERMTSNNFTNIASIGDSLNGKYDSKSNSAKPDLNTKFPEDDVSTDLDNSIYGVTGSDTVEQCAHQSPPSQFVSTVHIRPALAWYALAACCDLEANYLIICAFNYTTFTSVALLDCFTIPSG